MHCTYAAVELHAAVVFLRPRLIMPRIGMAYGDARSCAAHGLGVGRARSRGSDMLGMDVCPVLCVGCRALDGQWDPYTVGP